LEAWKYRYESLAVPSRKLDLPAYARLAAVTAVWILRVSTVSAALACALGGFGTDYYKMTEKSTDKLRAGMLTTCIHFDGVQSGKCKAGVPYASFEDESGKLNWIIALSIL